MAVSTATLRRTQKRASAPEESLLSLCELELQFILSLEGLLRETRWVHRPANSVSKAGEVAQEERALGDVSGKHVPRPHPLKNENPKGCVTKSKVCATRRRVKGSSPGFLQGRGKHRQVGDNRIPLQATCVLENGNGNILVDSGQWLTSLSRMMEGGNTQQ